MRFSLALCLLAIGVVCIASVHSTNIEKRFFLSSFVDSIKKDVKTVSNTVNGAVNTVTTFVNTQAKDLGNTVNKIKNTISNDATLCIKKTGDIVNEGIEFCVGTPDQIKQDAQDALKVTVQLEKTANTQLATLNETPFLQRGPIINDIIDDTVTFAATVVNDVHSAADYTIKEAEKIGEGIETIANKAYRATYAAAHTAFDKIKQAAGKVDWDKTVLLLIHFMGSPVADAVCQVACVGAASYFFGPEVMPFAELLCAPLCVAALAKLEDVAEKVAENAMKKN